MSARKKISNKTVGQRIGPEGYARMLACVVFSGAGVTWQEMAAAAPAERFGASVAIRGLLKQGLIHVAEVRVPEGADGRQREKVYKAGRGVNAQWPGGDARDSRPFVTRSNMRSFCAAIQELMEHAHNGKTLAEACDIHAKTALRILAALKTVRLIHIVEWEMREKFGAGAPLYKWGPGNRNVSKPKPLTSREISSRWARIRTERRRLLRTIGALQGAHVDKRRSAPKSAAAERGAA